MKISVLAMSVAVAILGGCGAQQIANTKQLDDAVVLKASKSELTPAQVCEQAGQSVAQADAEELRFYAPLHMKQAIENLEDGQKLIKSADKITQGVQSCYKASQLIVDGMDIKVKAKDMLKDALAQYDMLKHVDSANKYADDIQDHREDIQDLIKNIEAGKINEALKGQADLLKEMQALEIEMVLDYKLSPVVAVIDQAEDIDADELAEKTFDKAEKELESARKFITVNYRNNEEVERTSASAMRAAQHAFYVAKEVETLKELKPVTAEEKVLYIESLFENVNKRFNQDVVIGYSLYDQADIIGKRLATVLDENVTLGKEVAVLKQQGSVVVAQTPAQESVAPVQIEQASMETETGQKSADEAGANDNPGVAASAENVSVAPAEAENETGQEVVPAEQSVAE